MLIDFAHCTCEILARGDLGAGTLQSVSIHFYVPNHGKLWKSLMRVHLGDYEVYEIELEKNAKPS